MREEVISSGTVDPFPPARSSSPPPTPAASSAGASSPAAPTNIGSIDWLGSGQCSKAGSLSYAGSQPPRTSLSTNAGSSSSHSSCRPWERGDLLRRLATFKPANWSEKPKGASSLACARRGWMNVDTNKIECESCGVQLSFPTIASWTTAEAENAGEAFTMQLDVSHKVTCPWKGNCCADSLVQFPPTPPSALIGGYKDRCDGLLQFLTLPVIAISTVEKMRLSRSPQIDRLLLQPASSCAELGFRADNMPGMESPLADTSCTYYHAQKLISLCGWEPRWSLNVQDCEEHSAQSAKNAGSFGPSDDKVRSSQVCGPSKNAYSSSKRNTGKKKISAFDSRHNSRSPLLDCSLCGATVRIWDYLTVSRPARFGLNNIETPETGKKTVLTRGMSAASGTSGWVAASGMEKEQIEGRDEAPTYDEGRSLSNAGVDLNLTMAGGLPSAQFNVPTFSENFDNGSMGRDLIIGQPAGSEVGDRAISYESRGPSTRKRSMEEGGSTVDRPADRFQRTDSIEGVVIDRDGDEVDDGRQFSDGPSKRSRGLDIFGTYNSVCRMDSSGTRPSRSLGFEIDLDVNKGFFIEKGDPGVGYPSARDSARASSVIAMDTICHSAEEDSMESVENYPGDMDEVLFPSPSMRKNLDMNDTPEYNCSNQAQQSTCLQPAAGSIVREMGVSSTNDREETLNAETVTAQARDRFSFGVSGGSIGMGVSHEAEMHGIDVSVHRAHSIVGDVEPIAEVTENQGQTGESALGPGLMDEFVPEEIDREDPNGDSQDVISRSLGRADSGSKVYGPTKADSVESGEKISHPLGRDSSAHPSLSCNAGIYSAYEVSKEEVTQTGKASVTDDCVLLESDYVAANGLVNGENNYGLEDREFDPIKHHNNFCPWVNGNVAAAGCSSSSGSSSSSSSVALCGWELTLDALDAYQSLGHLANQTVESESAASLCKDEHLTPRKKHLTRNSATKSHGKC